MPIKILSIETVHVKSNGKTKSLRFARIVTEGDKTTHQILTDKKWKDVSEAEFPTKVKEARQKTIEQLSPAK